MSDLSGDEQKHLARCADFYMLQMTLPCPAFGRQHAVSSMATGPGYAFRADGVHMFDARFQFHQERKATVISWSRIEAHLGAAARADSTLVDDIRALERDRVRHQVDASRAYPGRWGGVPWTVPVNEYGQTWDEVEEYHQEVWWPAGRVLRERREAILQRIFPALTEPVDLLDLLAAQ